MTHYYYEPSSVSTSGGAWSGNTLTVVDALGRQVLIKAASSDTYFDVTITDAKDRDVVKYIGVREIVNDLLAFPAKGIYTVAIANATADEGFTVMVCFSEDR